VSTDRPRVDFIDAQSESDGDVLDGLVVLRDDADALGDRLGRDRVVAGHHDHLDAGRPALGDGVRHGRSRRVDHRHQTDEPQPGQREVLCVRVERITDWIPTIRYGRLTCAQKPTGWPA